MAPQKFVSASVRYKTRPAARVPFRDDTSLLAFRYEQTVQAQPPILMIPIPPRNPARASRPVSIASLSAAAAAAAATASAVVVSPPLIAPPQEQHPALRTRENPSSTSDDWKRDSGLAPTTTTSSSTIYEEDADYPTTLYSKLGVYDADVVADTEALPASEQVTEPRPATVAPLFFADGKSFATPHSQDVVAGDANSRRAQSAELPPHAFFESPRAAPIPSSPITRSSSSTDPSTPVSMSTDQFRSSRKLVRTSSNRTGMHSNKLKKKANVAGAGSTRSFKSLELPRSPPNVPGLDIGSMEDPCPIEPGKSDSSELTLITTTIPTDRLIEDDFLNQLTFSKRGSVMFGGKRALRKSKILDLGHPQMDQEGHHVASLDAGATPILPTTAVATTHVVTAETTDKSPPSRPQTSKTMQMPSIRVLPVDVERESQKVRSLYDSVAKGDDRDEWGPSSSHRDRLEPAVEVPSDEEENVADRSRPSSSDNRSHLPTTPTRAGLASSSPLQGSSINKDAYELAGGLEDWEDVDGADVDRYGFILPNPRALESRANSTDTRQNSMDTRPLRSLYLSPKKRNVLIKSPDGTPKGLSSLVPGRAPSRKVSARSLNTQTSGVSGHSRQSSRSSVRAAANLLPHNRDRKLTDEAGDMLSLAPGLSDIAEDPKAEKLTEAQKKKEWQRAEKWRKMAKINRKGQPGEGMEFEFDPTNSKVIDRTWKGIPDRWRAAAWYSFLASSAKKHGSTTTDEDLVAEFQRLQYVSSSDDTQIDLDVPRTINRHIMFRRRYRGGQRLLFRVLHALSLHFPDTGYVQGMAPLAATLLCYYDEEKTFIMLVRMWRYRGLERLYQPGFASLMTALKDFERDWLPSNDIARKLSELCIDPTAYATRWYLTLFNLSIPFQAQLRVWDVFMLLGEPSPIPTADCPEAPVVGLDILHATGAALMHALAEVLMDSDFENAMKALTSWIPVHDEEMLLKVTRTEWKQRQGKKKT
ncbi:hypothetical protein MCOR27_005771 [Pyricularia oryzae]|uniref:Rab-GAP TBC domain-containing protein n=2 Tax=Pyricularia TaxID=48558 RepID=A0ABQ8N819_PYRGI|nr:hypothetical protein MCOR01_006347 [Pyricularia oryzae]KAI6292277.1 hypothetical protein MCOR33_009994 [Pyricularia grisea]KAH9435681.1 hypothetical protein MCOR02_004603 [Pyricularia oryzae]KAI6252007.1 hypothetical protein MCOR19_011370 [Pyricularia oryzae]KAI6265644.1 hypothetical protein MCOR26_010624 [Pyricularia oryzae]